jgi:hypothetical protein
MPRNGLVMLYPFTLKNLDPATLMANPANWRVHPPEQIATAEALIYGRDGRPAEVGWGDAVRFNERTGRLVDGHMRVKLAADRGEPWVPVLCGNWTDEQERKLLLTHDSLGMMASADASLLRALNDSVSLDSPEVRDLMAQVQAAADLIPQETAPGDAAGEPAAGGDSTPSTPPAREAVPDALWASDNAWDVPSLLLDRAADAVDYPVTTWGSIGHGRAMGGTYHFYTADKRFDPLWSNPAKVLQSGCPSVVEPNFSTSEQTPFTVSMWAIFRKRWLARYWQSKGLRVFVDINVHHDLLAPHAALGGQRPNFLGVPKGWPSYATRSHGNNPSLLDTEHDAAAAHSGLERVPLFLVIGGGKATEAHCDERGWVWIPEQSQTARAGNDGD